MPAAANTTTDWDRQFARSIRGTPTDRHTLQAMAEDGIRQAAKHAKTQQRVSTASTTSRRKAQQRAQTLLVGAAVATALAHHLTPAMSNGIIDPNWQRPDINEHTIRGIRQEAERDSQRDLHGFTNRVHNAISTLRQRSTASTPSILLPADRHTRT
jgi:hypothetical protein